MSNVELYTFDDLVEDAKSHKLDPGVEWVIAHLDELPLQFRFKGATVTLIHEDCFRVSTRSTSMLVTPKDLIVVRKGSVIGKVTMDNVL